MRFIRPWVAVSLLLAGCGRSLPPLPSGADAAYLLDSGDQVRLIVYNDATLSQAYSVSDRGMISIPLIGEVPARHRTLEEVAAEIRTLLNNGIYKNVGLSVEIAQYRPIYLMGEVNKPGAYPYTPDLSALSAVSIAGGFTVRADEKDITVVRSIGRVRSEYRARPNSDVQPGDVIVVHEQFF